MNKPDIQPPTVPLPIVPPIHWTNSVVQCDKKNPNNNPKKTTHCVGKKTCKLMKQFVLQYY